MLKVVRPGDRPKAQQPPLNAGKQGRPEPTLMGRVIHEPIATEQPAGGEQHLKGGDGKIVHSCPRGDVDTAPNTRAKPVSKETGCPGNAAVGAVTVSPQRGRRVIPYGDRDTRPASPQLWPIAVKRVHPTIALLAIRLPPHLGGGARRLPKAHWAYRGCPTGACRPSRAHAEARVCREPRVWPNTSRPEACPR